MLIIDNFQDLNDWRLSMVQSGFSVGFVPTMGSLHLGHMALVDQAKKLSDQVLVSIFVNPLQFSCLKDYQQYPVDLDQDIDQLKQRGVDVLFLPTLKSLYPHGQKGALIIENLPVFNQYFCGEYRPGHFSGVASVILRFLILVQPNFIVLGEKDFQQLYLLRYLVKDFLLSVQVCSVSTVREKDGLAVSSRNRLLDSESRRLASNLYKLLIDSAKKIQAGGGIEKVSQWAANELQALGFLVEYFQGITHQSFHGGIVGTDECLILAAVYLKQVRLIDNYRFRVIC